MIYILLWYLIGLAPCALLVYCDYKDGKATTLNDILKVLLLSVGGVVILILIGIFWLDENGESVIIFTPKKK